MPREDQNLPRLEEDWDQDNVVDLVQFLVKEDQIPPLVEDGKKPSKCAESEEEDRKPEEDLHLLAANLSEETEEDSLLLEDLVAEKGDGAVLVVEEEDHVAEERIVG